MFSARGAGAVGTAIGRLRDTLRADLAPRDAESPLTLAKMQLSYGNMQSGMRMMPVLAVLCASAHLQWAPAGLVGAWLCVFIVVWAIRVRALAALPAAGALPETVRRTARRYFRQSTTFILAWGAQGPLFWLPDDPVNQSAIVLIMLASAMSASLTASWLPAAIIQIALYIGGVSALLFSTGTLTGLVLALACILFAAFIGLGLINLNNAARRMLRLEDEKDLLIADLRASNTAKSDFLANMSHELRTPLNAILGFSEVMQGEMFGPLGSAKYRDYAGDIHSSGVHLLSLINDVLDLAKIEAGRFIPADDRVSVLKTADEAVRLLKLKADETGVVLTLNVERNPVLRGDARALKQVLINLISNALKFTPAGGIVTVGARRTAFGATLIWVADTGCGISPEDQAKLFQTFGQGRHDIAVAEKGTGLGLAIAKGIVEAHGGTIGLDSAPGRGTTVTVSLPAARAMGSEPAMAA